MNIFIKIKAWQLFVIFIAPLLLEPLLLAFQVNLTTVIGIVTPLSSLVVIGWIWSIGITANRRLPSQLQRSALIYSGGLLFAIVYMFIFAFVLLPHPIPAWVIPIHLTVMFFMFYALWFSAKQFVALQQQKDVKFADFSGPFFLLWFYPIGVWFIQPQVNSLLGDVRE